MAALSLQLPDPLARSSSKVAKQLGLSRAEFIRRAVIHELQTVQKQKEQASLVKAFNAMKSNKEYLKLADELTSFMSEALPQEQDNWWTRKKN